MSSWQAPTNVWDPQQKSTEKLPGEWLKLGEAAYALGVSEVTLRRRLKQGKLEARFHEGKYYIFLERHPVTQRFLPPSLPIPPAPPWELMGAEEDFRQNTRPMVDKEVLTKSGQGPVNWEGELRRAHETIRRLQNTIADQETLIAFLEESLQKSQPTVPVADPGAAASVLKGA